VAQLGAGPRPPVVSLAPGPLRLIFGLREASVKIGGSALFRPIPRTFPV
jgi:hypothetical protein